MKKGNEQDLIGDNTSVVQLHQMIHSSVSNLILTTNEHTDVDACNKGMIGALFAIAKSINLQGESMTKVQYRSHPCMYV